MELQPRGPLNNAPVAPLGAYMKLIPISLKQANEYITKYHRHHKKVVGHKFSLGCEVEGILLGVCIVGRPVSRGYDKGDRLEVTRLCTTGGKNVCSFLYSAAVRATWALGYSAIGTYILENELGTSLKAAGFQYSHTTQGGSWDCKGRPRIDKFPTCKKQYWEKIK